ncbi:MAG: hypothetical protein ACRCT8_04760 [Lacipirellulaceae bacterium]
MQKLARVTATLAILAGAAPSASAVDLLSPSDVIRAIDRDLSSRSDYPDGEPPSALFDGLASTKYLNFAQRNSGFIITPSTLGAARSFRITTANDAPERDPATWEVYGTNSPITSLDDSAGDGETWSFLAGGGLSLPNERSTAGSVVSIANNASFSSYRVVFPSLKNDVSACCLQIADFELFSTPTGTGGSNLIGAFDPVLAIHRPTSESRYPGGEGPANLLDTSAGSKYLNFGRENVGFIVTPAIGSSVMGGFALTTANDFAQRDPSSYELYGTNATIASAINSNGEAEAWTLISQGPLSLPADRLTLSPTVNVTNTTAYRSYKMVFPTIVGPSGGFPGDSLQLGGVRFFSAAPGQAKLQINRATGEVRIVANESIQVGSYSVISDQFGSLSDPAWQSIAATGDSDSGGSRDPNDVWVELSPAGSNSLLSEQDVAGGGANDGLSLTAGQSYSLGNVWLKTPFEDMRFALRNPSGNTILADVEYVGAALVEGDYNGDGLVNATDWPLFRAGYGGQYAGRSVAEAYVGGDLDGDLDSDLSDFKEFLAAAGVSSLSQLLQVPEPTSGATLIAGLCALVGAAGRRARRAAGVTLAAAAMGAASPAGAQTFSVVGTAPVATTPDPTENAESGPGNFFDDGFIDGAINDELFVLDYNDPNLVGDYLQYQGLGSAPKTVFLDYGASVSANWFAYAQRSGADPSADRVGKFELWFSNTDFGGVLPVSAPQSVVQLSPGDNRLGDSTLRPYTLGGDRNGRYVAVRLTVSELSADRPTNNIGGHEFRLLSGPSDVVLEIDRGTGAMTLRNNLSGAGAVEMRSYAIESDLGGLRAASFNGVRGDSAAFPAGNGSGNGWELGGGSNQQRLTEASLLTGSTLAAGVSSLALGAAYNPLSLADDVAFSWSNSAGRVYNGRVAYVGTAPNVLPGDYNNDGRVNAGDYTVWRDALGTAAVLPNDATPGSVDQLDYDRWESNYGRESMTATAVPEPVGIAAAIVAIAAIGARRRR